MKKIIFRVTLLVIIPLLCAFAIGLYGYNRYQPVFANGIEKKGYYDVNVEEENAQSKIDAYLKLNTTYYKEILSKEIKNKDGKKLFTLKGYAYLKIELDENGEELGRNLKYLFFAYDLNYGYMYKEIYTSPNAKLGAYMPYISLNFIDRDKKGTDEELSNQQDMGTFIELEILDYNWVGYTTEDGTETQKNGKGERIYFNDNYSSKPYVASAKSLEISGDRQYSENIDLEVMVVDYEHPSDAESTVVVDTISFDNFVQKAKFFEYEDEEGNLLEGIVKGYDNDIFEAGYFKYAFSRYIWWEALIAIVLTLLVTGATVLVWSYSDEKEKKLKSIK